jgi:hypothetical protein
MHSYSSWRHILLPDSLLLRLYMYLCIYVRIYIYIYIYILSFIKKVIQILYIYTHMLLAMIKKVTQIHEHTFIPIHVGAIFYQQSCYFYMTVEARFMQRRPPKLVISIDLRACMHVCMYVYMCVRHAASPQTRHKH